MGTEWKRSGGEAGLTVEQRDGDEACKAAQEEQPSDFFLAEREVRHGGVPHVSAAEDEGDAEACEQNLSSSSHQSPVTTIITIHIKFPSFPKIESND